MPAQRDPRSRWLERLESGLVLGARRGQAGDATGAALMSPSVPGRWLGWLAWLTIPSSLTGSGS